MSPRIEMPRRHLYETAFDSKISKSDDDLDNDDVINKSILFLNEDGGRRHGLGDLVRPKSVIEGGRDMKYADEIAKAMGCLELNKGPYISPTPPSSAPLPPKFRSSICIATVHSAPDIPIRAKDLRLPVKSSKYRGHLRPNSFCADNSDISSSQTTSIISSKSQDFCRPPKPRPLEILEIKNRTPRTMKFSSTESMATSSSGGSLESLRSSTSEGNRSSSSYESRRSSSLSSHSSDSLVNITGLHTPFSTLSTRVFQQNKLNILSPISDKSSQEPCSETSENNKNNNSERGSPEEMPTPTSESQKKRRTPVNRNLINLSLRFDHDTQQGSDSGISMESRINKANQPEISDLPFDMPKLRRRRLQESNSAQDTSGSATSVDLGDLPFDMPKLKRRMRTAASDTPSNQPPASLSLPETKLSGVTRPSLSLDLQDCKKIRLPLQLDFDVAKENETIDTSLPLEQQGWYHGVITRLEAENILRKHKEWSFLVRNSESMKQDYSLSLKSSMGFMHIRIQNCKETGKYSLGHSKTFSTIPEMVKYYSHNRLPIRGAEHMFLAHPVIEQLL